MRGAGTALRLHKLYYLDALRHKLQALNTQYAYSTVVSGQAVLTG